VLSLSGGIDAWLTKLILAFPNIERLVMDKLSIFRITVALSLALTVDALCESDAVAMDPAANTRLTIRPQKAAKENG